MGGWPFGLLLCSTAAVRLELRTDLQMQQGPAQCSCTPGTCNYWHFFALLLPLQLLGAGPQSQLLPTSMILGQLIVASANCSQPALHPVWHLELLGPPPPPTNSSIVEHCLQAAGDYSLLLLSHTSSGKVAPATCWGVKDTWSNGTTAGPMTGAPSCAPLSTMSPSACGPNTLDFDLCGVTGYETLQLVSSAVNVSSSLVYYLYVAITVYINIWVCVETVCDGYTVKGTV